MVRRWKTTGLWETANPREALTEAAKQRSRVLETWLRARGVRLDAADDVPGVGDIIRQNVALISNLKRRTQNQVAKVIRQANAEAWTRDKLSRALSDRFAIAERHAVLIARDQIGKLNGAIVQRRSQELGITGYVWVTSADKRVRPIHRRLNNTKHTWDKPPVVSPDGRHEHPGGDFQCRCTAEPDLSEILDEPAPIAHPSRQVGSIAQSVFGREVSGRDLDALMGLRADLPAGYSFSIAKMDERTTRAGRPTVSALVQIKAPDGTNAGLLSRDFYRKNGVPTATHATFFVDEAHQGAGLGRALFNAQIEAYRRTGLIRNVELNAIEVGRYVWTKAGFEWPATETAKLLGHLRTRLEGMGANVDAILTRVKTPQDVAALEVAGVRVGKDLLINYPEDTVQGLSQTPDKIEKL